MNPFRTPIIAGNWKMNAGGRDACALARAVARGAVQRRLVEVVVAPPYTALAAAAYEIEQIAGSVETSANEDGKRGVGVAAQNMHARTKGAFTGEVSAPMLRDAGVSWVIIGHSERRQLFGETDATVKDKVDAAFAANLRPIVCVGETLEEREAGRTLEVVERQLRAFMNHFLREPGFGVVAYEPVWAIGTGKVASPSDAQEVHARIRKLLGEVSEEVADSTRILYGGSVKGDNAEGLLWQEDVDGALVGGASLEAAGFVEIIASAQHLAERLAEEAGTNDESTEPATPAAESEPAQQTLVFHAAEALEEAPQAPVEPEESQGSEPLPAEQHAETEAATRVPEQAQDGQSGPAEPLDIPSGPSETF
jgi:triosephosphate isomerase